MDPLLAYRCATYHGAYRLQRTDLGLVAAGRRADIVILSDLEKVTVDDVLFDDGTSRRRASMLVDVVEGPSDPPLDTMRLDHVDVDDMVLRLDVPDGMHRVRTIADPS